MLPRARARARKRADRPTRRPYACPDRQRAVHCPAQTSPPYQTIKVTQECLVLDSTGSLRATVYLTILYPPSTMEPVSASQHKITQNR